MVSMGMMVLIKPEKSQTYVRLDVEDGADDDCAQAKERRKRVLISGQSTQHMSPVTLLTYPTPGRG